VGLERNICNYF